MDEAATFTVPLYTSYRLRRFSRQHLRIGACPPRRCFTAHAEASGDAEGQDSPVETMPDIYLWSQGSVTYLKLPMNLFGKP